MEFSPASLLRALADQGLLDVYLAVLREVDPDEADLLLDLTGPEPTIHLSPRPLRHHEGNRHGRP